MFAYGALVCIGLALPTLPAYPPVGWGGGRAIHPNYTPHWGCFGYCNGPLRPNHAMCFGYCPGPHWGCYGYCNGPFWTRSPFFWGPAVTSMPDYLPPTNPTVIYQGNLRAQVPPQPAPDSNANSDAAVAPTVFKSGVDQWMEQLASPSAKKRGEAVEWLGKFGAKAAKAVDVLIPMLADRDPLLRVEVTITLAKIGPAAVPGLTQALQSDNKLIQMGSCLTLGHMGKGASAAVPALKGLLKSNESAVACHAAQALWRIDPSNKDVAIPVLTAALSDKQLPVRMGALTTLSQMGPAAEPAIPAITQLLQDKDGQFRVAAAVTLNNIAPSNTAALPALLAALGDKSEAVRRDAAAALANMSVSGLDAGTALAPLTKALRDDDVATAHEAAIALAHLGAAAVPALTEALTDKKLEARRYAIMALEQIGKPAASALPKLRQVAKDDNDDEIKFIAQEAADAITAAK